MRSLSRNLIALGIVALLGMQPTFGGQSPEKKADAFDISRFNTDAVGYFSPFYVTTTKSLKDVLASQVIKPDTQVLVTETAGGKLALLTEQMAYHHLAQGVSNGRPWMATF